MSMWIAGGTIVAGIGGSLISGNAASKSQAAANATNRQIASDANKANWNQYLLARGINPGGLPGVTSGAVNTVLPLGFTLNGQPAEQELFNRIMARGGSTVSDPSAPANIGAFLAANPQVRDELQQMLTASNDERSVEDWIAADIQAGDPNFTNQLKTYADQAQATSAQQYALPPQYQRLLDYGPQTLDQLYGGAFLQQQQGAQGAINAARLDQAATVQQRIDEQRQKFGDLNAGQLSGLDRILSARTTGSQGIYDASLTQADTYANSVKQATANELQRQQAARALQGFIGEGSGDRLLRARTLAGGYQAAAGARAQAGVDQATRLYGITDSDATSRFGVNSEYLQALSKLLNADGAAARAGARVDNATGNAAVLSGDISSRLANLGVGGQLTTQRQSIDQQQTDSRYRDLNNLLSTLGFFRQNQPATPGVVSPQVGSVISGGQLAGGAISAAASGIGQYYQNQQLISALKGMGGSGGGIPSGGFAGDGVN